jgi:hypothetical protein
MNLASPAESRDFVIKDAQDIAYWVRVWLDHVQYPASDRAVRARIREQ